jgi:hypothetical protein
MGILCVQVMKRRKIDAAHAAAVTAEAAAAMAAALR